MVHNHNIQLLVLCISAAPQLLALVSAPLPTSGTYVYAVVTPSGACVSAAHPTSGTYVYAAVPPSGTCIYAAVPLSGTCGSETV